MLSIRGWEQLTAERGWSTELYVSRMQELAKRAFMREPAETRPARTGGSPDGR
jgi:hypothetical protein